MSHNSGQNIDDMLKMLKASVEKDTSDSEASGAPRGRKKKSADVEMSAEDLQNELRSQFMSGDDVYGGDDNFEEEDTYKLDDDFLAEAQLENDEQEISEEIETPEEEIEEFEEPEEEAEEIEEESEELADYEEAIEDEISKQK